MPRQAICPSCQARVEVADAATTATCPRCLARIVPVPPVATPAPPPLPAAAAAPGVPGTRPCPSCGKPVAESWRYCPHCASWAAGSKHAERLRTAASLPLEAQVARDSKRVGKGMIVLACFGALGLLQMAGLAVNAAVAARDPTSLIILFGGVVFLVVCATGITYARAGGNPAAMGPGRILIGALSLMGGLFLAATVLGLVLVVILFIQCSQGFR